MKALVSILSASLLGLAVFLYFSSETDQVVGEVSQNESVSPEAAISKDGAEVALAIVGESDSRDEAESSGKAVGTAATLNGESGYDRELMAFLPSDAPEGAVLDGLRLSEEEAAEKVEALLQFPHNQRRVLLSYDDGVTSGLAGEVNELLGLNLNRHYGSMGNGRMVALELNGDYSVRETLIALMQSGLAVYVEPDYELSVAENSTDSDPIVDWIVSSVEDAENGVEALPNDYSTYNLYAMSKTSSTTAWDSLPSSPGSPIVVAVIDTGIRWTHEDLAANMWVNTGEVNNDGVDNDGNGYIDDRYGYNAIANRGNPTDDHGHGTHCAGTVGAVGNNGKGVVGVAWKVNVELMGVKFMASNGSGYTSDAVECVRYAVDNGADVLSNSWGGGGYSSSLYSAIEYARQRDILFVAAAGNTSANNDSTPHYPSSYSNDNIIAVASSDSADKRSYFSCYGRQSVDVFAPGSYIYSTDYSSDTAYSVKSGTSMATPLVAGMMAVLKDRKSTESYKRLKERLLSSVDLVGAFSGLVTSEGRVNLSKALGGDLSFGDTDRLWYHSATGRIALWKMSGTSISQFYVLGQRVSGWELKARTDFDNDGDDDLLWYYDGDGSVAVWYMNGTTMESYSVLNYKVPGWDIVAVGNFDSDSDYNDILWQSQATGQIVVWYMNGERISSHNIFESTVFGWDIVGATNPSGNGNLDIYWHSQSSGQICVWHMTGMALNNYDLFLSTAVGWDIKEVKDYDNNGSPDFFWFNPNSGQQATWYMNGLNLQSYNVNESVARGWELSPQSQP